ncbi:3-isopropylmalate dehydratase small subunit [Henriciella mobilis]|uniref:3-isopropylmalate dehydratase n=1 Tax=Henriciella mobilis TaxID=2305467 RepID=A0A399RRT1_9PROT|nr:hypothetical protein [Henriciella mobilis]RIJ32739.1 hypothetical protein D1223_02510 [Henriciella mobilis]
MSLLYQGRCWKFGDDVSCDGDIVSLELAFARETRPSVLREALFAHCDPGFSSKVNDGDLIVAGKRFGTGHAHPQAAYALSAAKVGVIAASIPRGHFRNLVMAGVPFLTCASQIVAGCESGDRLVVDFERGTIHNKTRSTSASIDPLPDVLLETIRIGGWKEAFRRRLQNG